MKPTIGFYYYNNSVEEKKDGDLIIECLQNYFNIQVNDEFLTKKYYIGGDSSPDLYICNNYYTNKNIFENKPSVLICNEEWLAKGHLEYVKDYNYVIVKSSYAKKIVEKYNKNVIVLPFWSKDRYIEGIKEKQNCLHVVGKSIQKGTEFLLDIPNLTLYDASGRYKDLDKRCNYKNKYFPDAKISIAYNKNNLHLCPSIYESHGHYMYESLTCGKKPIVTKLPMWKEYIPDDIVTYIDVTRYDSHPSFDFLSKAYIKPYVFREAYVYDKQDLYNKIEENINCSFDLSIRKYILNVFEKRKANFLKFILDLL